MKPLPFRFRAAPEDHPGPQTPSGRLHLVLPPRPEQELQEMEKIYDACGKFVYSRILYYCRLDKNRPADCQQADNDTVQIFVGAYRLKQNINLIGINPNDFMGMVTILYLAKVKKIDITDFEKKLNQMPEVIKTLWHNLSAQLDTPEKRAAIFTLPRVEEPAPKPPGFLDQIISLVGRRRGG